MVDAEVEVEAVVKVDDGVGREKRGAKVTGKRRDVASAQVSLLIVYCVSRIPVLFFPKITKTVALA